MKKTNLENLAIVVQPPTRVQHKWTHSDQEYHSKVRLLESYDLRVWSYLYNQQVLSHPYLLFSLLPDVSHSLPENEFENVNSHISMWMPQMMEYLLQLEFDCEKGVWGRAGWAIIFASTELEIYLGNYGQGETI